MEAEREWAWSPESRLTPREGDKQMLRVGRWGIEEVETHRPHQTGRLDIDPIGPVHNWSCVTSKQYLPFFYLCLHESIYFWLLTM